MTPLGLTTSGEPLGLDLDALIGSHLAVIANSGGGKSGALRKLLEGTAGQVQHIILDVEDEFYTLRQRFDYVVAGGADGDLPITVAGAAALARRALEHGFSLIVQLNDLGADAPAFVAAFVEGLMAAPRAYWHPVLVVMDEAQRLVSAKTPTEALPAVKDLLYRGRKRGFTAVLASLRMADGIAPEIRGMVNNWLLGRSGQALDRNTMADQLGFTAKEGRELLRAMAPRRFWAMGPALSAEPVLFTVGDVETTIVRSGQAKVPTPPAPEALREILAALAAPAAAELPDDTIPDDPAAAYAKGGVIGTMILERDRRIEELETALAARDARIETLEFVSGRALTIADRQLKDIEQLLALFQDPSSETASAPVAATDAEDAPPAVGGTPPPPPPASASEPPAGDRELRALAGLAVIFPAGLTEAAWATRTGYSRKGGAWIRRRKRYVDDGMVEQRDGRWFATEAGAVAAAGEVPAMPPPGRALVDWWAQRLGAPGRLLKVLADVAPRQLTREALAAEVSMSAKGGAFLRHVGELKSAELVVDAGKRLAIAPELLA